MKQKKTKKQLKFALEDITAIHGLVYLTLRSKRRYGWLLLMISNVVFTVYLLIVIKNRFDSSQIYIRVDSTCRVNQVPFPSVIICNVNTISQNETRNIRDILLFYKRNESEIESFFGALYELTHYVTDKVGHFPEIRSILEQHYFNIDSIMAEVHQTCENLLVHCEFNGIKKKCEEVFQLIKTLEGYCCAFNYAALNENTEDAFTEGDEDIEFYDERKTGAIISTSKSGRASGLTVLFNVQPQDYPPWIETQFYGAKVLINDPNDYPETTVTTTYAQLGRSLNLLIEPMIYTSEPSFRRASVEQRQCWLHDEVDLAHTDRYSFETCRTECNIKKFFHFCNCVPYKYPREMASRVCGLSDLPCLHNVLDNLVTKRLPKEKDRRVVLVRGLSIRCFCALECNDKKYKVTQNVIPLTKTLFPARVMRDVNMSEVSALKVFYDKSTCNCYEKTLLLDFTRLAGTYGGVFSLSIGGSIITIVEVTYSLFVYLLQEARRLLIFISRKRSNK